MRWRESEYIKHNINKVGPTGAVTWRCIAHLRPWQDMKTGSATQICLHVGPNATILHCMICMLWT